MTPLTPSIAATPAPRRKKIHILTIYVGRSPGCNQTGTRIATPRRPIFSMACCAMCSRAVSFWALAETGTKESVAWEGVTPRRAVVGGGAWTWGTAATAAASGGAAGGGALG